MRRLWFVPTALVAAVLLVVAGMAAVAPASSAQDASGTPGAAGHDHPAHIHSGSCATLGGVDFPLNNLTDAAAATPAAGTDASAMGGTPTAATEDAVAWSTTTVEASLDDILSAERAVNVHESPTAIDVYIACGDLAGATPEDGQVQIDLNEQNESGYEGTAVLQDNGDGTTTVTVTLTSAEGGLATPAA